MPSRFRTRQAGEGKVGCFVTLAILIIAIAAAIKAGPVYYSNSELVAAINNDIAPMASRVSEEQVAEQVRAKAKELGITEALKAGAVQVQVRASEGDAPGSVHIVLHYERPVDFYGVHSYTFVTDETIDRVVYTNIK